jgi:hypothetical protein
MQINSELKLSMDSLKSCSVSRYRPFLLKERLEAKGPYSRSVFNSFNWKERDCAVVTALGRHTGAHTIRPGGSSNHATTDTMSVKSCAYSVRIIGASARFHESNYILGRLIYLDFVRLPLFLKARFGNWLSFRPGLK